MKTRLGILLLLTLMPTCACWARSKPNNSGFQENWEANLDLHCYPNETTCGASGLPRATERDWTPAEINAFVARAKQGSVAVDRREGKIRIKPGCQLSGAYLEILGTKGSGRLWVTNRPLFRTDEVGDDCADSTHVVAAYARKGARFEAILVPLPCPPTADTTPARRCLARGLTGPERMKRAAALLAKLDADDDDDAAPDPAGERKVTAPQILEPWVLAPDEYSTTRWLSGLPNDCAFAAHGVWLASVYSAWDDGSGHPRTIVGPKPAPPAFAGLLSQTGCIYRPVFLFCFAGLFEPVHSEGSCWSPADPKVHL